MTPERTAQGRVTYMREPFIQGNGKPIFRAHWEVRPRDPLARLKMRDCAQATINEHRAKYGKSALGVEVTYHLPGRIIRARTLGSVPDDLDSRQM